jgi:CAAX prenyl protease-like protein
VLHSAWVAGILAGVAYAAVRLYRGRLADAVLAHAVTNLLLSAYVLNTGSWSYW